MRAHVQFNVLPHEEFLVPSADPFPSFCVTKMDPCSGTGASCSGPLPTNPPDGLRHPKGAPRWGSLRKWPSGRRARRWALPVLQLVPQSLLEAERVNTSSESKNTKKSPDDTDAPMFRQVQAPLGARSWMWSWILESSAAHARIRSCPPSVLPSSTTTHSQSLWVWAFTLSAVCFSTVARLKSGVMMETLAMVSAKQRLEWLWIEPWGRTGRGCSPAPWFPWILSSAS